MQVRLLVVGVTLLFLAGASFTASSGLAVAAAASSSWLGAHYWQRIMGQVLRHPILLALDIVIAFAILELGGPLGPFFLFTIVTSAVAGLLFRWRGIVYFCLLQILCYYAAVATASTGDTWTFQALAGQPAYYPLIGFVGSRVRRLLDEQAAMEGTQRQAEVDAAAADERTRLARELHDSLAKTLRGIAISAQALPMWIERSPERAIHEAKQIVSAAETGSREARELVANLRTRSIDQPLVTLIHTITEEWANRTDTTVRTEVANVELTLLARHEAVAVLNEALVNIERHAGAGHACVTLTHDGERAILVISDNGAGFRAGHEGHDQREADHYGLVGMKERAARATGEVAVTSAPGEGTTVRATFPLHSTSREGTSPDGQAPNAAAPRASGGLETT